ncbi:MAG: hypothetical protein OXL34_09125 [Gemmatimonadota bacterium]|nr:hypothetical protein [Gemmatimonadota bacterium]
MERLNLEQLARLVDEPPTPEERAVLEGDPGLRRELDALRSQTEALGNLPAVLPPPGGWHELEKKLMAAGLILGGRSNAHLWRKWLQVAAALVIFVGGTTLGWVTGSAPAGFGGAEVSSEPASYASLEEAMAAVDEAADRYRAAYGGLQQFVSAEGLRGRSRDPAAHIAALETLMAASRAAVEESPGDPFWNDVYVRSLAEHDFTIREVIADWR